MRHAPKGACRIFMPPILMSWIGNQYRLMQMETIQVSVREKPTDLMNGLSRRLTKSVGE